MESSRRTFLKQTAAVSATCLVGFEEQSPAMGAADGAVAAAPGFAGQGWYDRPMRWAQVSFVESDPGNYDQAFWLDYFKRIHADAALLNAGGCVAFYPTENVVFASDCPFDPEKGTGYIRETLRILESLNLPKDKLEKIYFKNLENLTGTKLVK